MKLDIAEQWVAALRSGDYKQGSTYLKAAFESRGPNYCCLGVLCELAERAGVITSEVTSSGVTRFKDLDEDKFGYQEGDAGLMTSVIKWAGFGRYFGALGYVKGGIRNAEHDYYYSSLATGNDQGISFSEIADYIEAHASEL